MLYAQLPPFPLPPVSSMLLESNGFLTSVDQEFSHGVLPAGLWSLLKTRSTERLLV